MSTIEVAGFDDDEARRLADRVPRLRSVLFAQNERVRDMARRPFFASVLARSIQPATTSSPAASPKSEIDLVEVWWGRGGYAAEGADTTRRQRTLKQLARSGASTMGRRMSIDDLDAVVLNDLKRDGIISDVRVGHTVKFTHDIFFEWSFLHLLIARETEWLAEIREAGEPPVLGRVVELLSQSIFMADDGWEEPSFPDRGMRECVRNGRALGSLGRSLHQASMTARPISLTPYSATKAAGSPSLLFGFRQRKPAPIRMCWTERFP